MLTDGAIAELARLLLTSPDAAAITHIDLSRNQLLTWRCCSALGSLLQADNMSCGRGNNPQQQQQPEASTTGQVLGPRPSSARPEGLFQPPLALPGHQCHAYVVDSNTAANIKEQPLELGLQRAPVLQQVLFLQFLSLEGVALGDKGAAALTTALQGSQHLQVTNPA